MDSYAINFKDITIKVAKSTYINETPTIFKSKREALLALEEYYSKKIEEISGELCELDKEDRGNL